MFSIKKMSSKKQLEPLRPPLDYKEVCAAVDDLVSYPRVIRSETDPSVANQVYGLVSLRLLDQPYVSSRGKKVYGLLKLRGNVGSREQALMDCSKIIREVDSVDAIKIVPVGNWVPLTDDDAFCKEKLDVKMSDEEMSLRDMSQEDKRKKEESIKKELTDRIEVLRNEKDIHDDPTTLKFYCMKRVVEMNLREEITRKERMIKEHVDKHERILRELRKLQAENPTYVDDWVNMYNSERQSVGLCPYIMTESEKKNYFQSVENARE